MIFLAAAAGGVVACNQRGPSSEPAATPTRPPKLKHPDLYPKFQALTSQLDTTQSAPSIIFDPSKARITDAGTNRKPAIFRYEASSGSLKEKNSDIPAEVKTLISATANTEKNVRVSITPMWFQPSRDRFFHAGDWGHDRGAGKQYATLTIGFSQRAALPELMDQPLSWANAWSFITNGTQDVPTAILSGDSNSKNTFQRMPTVDGQGTIGIEFISGTSNNNFQRTLNSIFSPVTGVVGAGGNPLNALGVPAASITTAIGYLSAVSSIVSTLSNGRAEIAVDLKNANTRVVVDSSAFFPDDDVALRLPSGKATFFFVPDPDRANFVKTLKLMATNKHRARLTSSNGLVVEDENGGVVTTTSYAIDERWKAIGPLEPYTIVVVETYVEMVTT